LKQLAGGKRSLKIQDLATTGGKNNQLAGWNERQRKLKVIKLLG